MGSTLFVNVDIGYAASEATRVNMFGRMLVQVYRKAAAWFRTLDGGELFGEGEADWIRTQAQDAENDFLADSLPLKMTRRFNVGRFYFHQHGHFGETHLPAFSGWMVRKFITTEGRTLFS